MNIKPLLNEKRTINDNRDAFIVLCALGIMARFFVMQLGHNYDFESYMIVGDIVSKGGNVYAETYRYNYGFVFFLIQGLGYKVSQLFPEALEGLYRVYIVSILTMADLFITLHIVRKYSYRCALLFFLNPIVIVITGYHNQFDNIALLLAFVAIDYYDEKKSFSKDDIKAITLLSFSLLVKHIMAFFFIWILASRKFSNPRKRIAYACVPPVVFLISFIPFCLGNKAAFEGILNNVFLYKSYNNYPLLSWFLDLAGVSDRYYFFIFIFIIIVIGVLSRNMELDKAFLLYTASLVAFSSAIANQYLIIPMIALATYKNKAFYWIYTAIGSFYCILNQNELHLADRFSSRFPNISSVIELFSVEGGITVTIMTIVLFAFIIVFMSEQRGKRQVQT